MQDSPIIPNNDNPEKSIIVYMDKIDFDYELCNAAESNVYKSVDAVLKYRPCAKECGVVEVEIRFKRIMLDSKKRIMLDSKDQKRIMIDRKDQ